jgi:hypothetical protein
VPKLIFQAKFALKDISIIQDRLFCFWTPRGGEGKGEGMARGERRLGKAFYR